MPGPTRPVVSMKVQLSNQLTVAAWEILRRFFHCLLDSHRCFNNPVLPHITGEAFYSRVANPVDLFPMAWQYLAFNSGIFPSTSWLLQNPAYHGSRVPGLCPIHHNRQWIAKKIRLFLPRSAFSWPGRTVRTLRTNSACHWQSRKLLESDNYWSYGLCTTEVRCTALPRDFPFVTPITQMNWTRTVRSLSSRLYLLRQHSCIVYNPKYLVERV